MNEIYMEKKYRTGFSQRKYQKLVSLKTFEVEDDPQVVKYFCFVCCEDNFSGTNRYEITK